MDLRHKRCEFAKCEIRPTYALQGNKAQFCKDHKEDDMIDVVSRVCKNETCSLQPSYAMKDSKLPEYCKEHKKDGMINLKLPKCQVKDCEKYPRFSSPDDTSRLAKYCAEHKSDDMIDIHKNICDSEKCSTRASYGKPGKQKTKCAQHREPGMIRRPNGQCKQCKSKAIYGKNLELNHCETHKESDELNLLEKACSSCGLSMVLDKDNKCEYCNPLTSKKAHLEKQNALFAYLDSKGLKGTSSDTIIDGGVCGKERPDRIFETDTFILILECDEHQHKERSCECEQTRMINIGQAYGGMPVYFLRWNPDKYKPSEKNIKVASIRERHTLVGEYIQSILNNKSERPYALVSVLHMYFDGWSHLANSHWKILTSYEV